MPLWAIIAIAAGALLLLVLFGGWLLGFAPLGRLQPLRASATEASERAADAAAEFWDWLRYGR
jgi:hypothetical protein